jgi:hypothetical protein
MSSDDTSRLRFDPLLPEGVMDRVLGEGGTLDNGDDERVCASAEK